MFLLNDFCSSYPNSNMYTITIILVFIHLIATQNKLLSPYIHIESVYTYDVILTDTTSFPGCLLLSVQYHYNHHITCDNQVIYIQEDPTCTCRFDNKQC